MLLLLVVLMDCSAFASCCWLGNGFLSGEDTAESYTELRSRLSAFAFVLAFAEFVLRCSAEAVSAAPEIANRQIDMYK